MKQPTPSSITPSKPERALQASASFFRERPGESTVGSGEDEVLQLFRRVSAQVPAYGKFLRKHDVDPESVASIDRFRELPITTKRNYHVAYPLPELCSNGRLEDCDMLAVSSGSTGEPTVWPRFIADEVGTLRRFEQVLVQGFGADGKRTLAIVCFALGSWVGGMYTTSACRQLAAKGYPITVVTPGNNFAEILRVIPKLAPFFDQVVLLGYPPFIKDVLDRGTAAGIPWANYCVKVAMAGEVFSEAWRDRVTQRLGQSDPEHSTASLYGTADAGVIANETPASILARRAIDEHPELVKELFGQARLPTLCQYDPAHRFFEQVDGELVLSGDGGIPLVRYNILDRGGLLTHAQLSEYLEAKGLMTDALRTQFERFPQPFVYVFGRDAFAVSYYGANVFPENVAIGLEQPQFGQVVTGKFVLEVVEDAQQDSVLQVTVELASGQTAPQSLRQDLSRAVTEHLTRVNSEFANYVPEERQEVAIRLMPAGDPGYFPVGVKHRYTR